MLAQSTSKNLLFIYSVICDQTVKSDLLGVFLANSSMFPNPFLLAVLLSHSCRRSPPGHSALALSQYKVICLRMFFTLCSVLHATLFTFHDTESQTLKPEVNNIWKRGVFHKFSQKIWPYVFWWCFENHLIWLSAELNSERLLPPYTKIGGNLNTCCAALCLTLALWARLQSCIKCRVSSQL